MKFSNIRQKLTFSFIVIIISTVLTIGIIISVIFSAQLTGISKKQLNLRIEKISKEIEDQLLYVMKTAERVSSNDTILHSMNTSAIHEPDYMQKLRSSIGKIEHQSPLIERIIVLNHNLEILDPVYARPVYSSSILKDDDFTEFLKNRNFYYFAKPGAFPIDNVSREGTLQSFTMAMYQRLLDENYWLMGYLIAVLNQRMLFNSVWDSSQKQVFSGINIFNERNELLFRNGLTFSPESINNDIDYSKLTGSITMDAMVNSEKCLILIKLIPSVNWFVTGIIPYSLILKDLNIALRLIFLIGLLFTLVTGVISFIIARTITKPIVTIVSAMHSYENTGSLEPLSLKASGELKYLGDVYNKLVTQINMFIENIYKEQEEKHAAELQSVKYELDFLQAQINPHFIHNTLNAIGYQAEKDGNKVVYNTLRSFNILLRAAISGIEDHIPLKQECTLVENFITIQRLRYGDTFKINISIPDELGNKKVPKLILQPLVENAIFHGISSTRGNGVIDIIVYNENPDLILEVKDNGEGTEYSLETTKSKFNKIGLQNVDERIKILFGSRYGVSIHGNPGKGTTVRIVLPLEDG
ncbi:MAG: sensor histidine kinase [Spirochaetes bacterium]|nr:MAG: sensor histidine kinase [Spirochaetota bacterium]